MCTRSFWRRIGVSCEQGHRLSHKTVRVYRERQTCRVPTSVGDGVLMRRISSISRGKADVLSTDLLSLLIMRNMVGFSAVGIDTLNLFKKWFTIHYKKMSMPTCKTSRVSQHLGTGETPHEKARWVQY